MEKIFFYLTIVLTFLVCGSCCFSSLQSVGIKLPQWPPCDCMEKYYPDLSRWLIEVNDSENQKIYVDKDCQEFSLQLKNPNLYSVTATPLTYDSGGREVVFFKPAGFLSYSDKKEFLWENGFSAEVLGICLKGSENKSEALNYLSHFNWKRFTDLVGEKIKNGKKSFLEDGEGSFYNPWQLEVSKIAALICGRKFSSSSLNIPASKTYSFKSDSNQEKGLLSSFVCENEICGTYERFCLNKDVINLFSMYNEYGVLFQCSNLEKVSTKTVNLPIYIE